jgi:dolichol-phosphate mannosyltransferase
MDADFSHHPGYIRQMLLEAVNGTDLIIGSRYKDGVRIQGWSKVRLAISRLANIFTRSVLALPVADITSGYRCFNAKALEKIDLSLVRSEGYAFQIEMVFWSIKKGLAVKEVPIIFFERTGGRSKFTFRHISEAFFTVLRLKAL